MGLPPSIPIQHPSTTLSSIPGRCPTFHRDVIGKSKSKRAYSPRGLGKHLMSRSHLSLPKNHGFVFCHRGLYDRALRLVDNSDAAINHGLREGFFLHEVDAFSGRRIQEGFIAHDKTADRVTPMKGIWSLHSITEILETNLPCYTGNRSGYICWQFHTVTASGL